MAGKALVWKITLTLLTLVIYGLLLSRQDGVIPRGGQNPGEKPVPARKIPPLPEEPYCAAHFVNQAQEGIQCHVSCLAPAGDGRLLCTWYAGSREGAPDVALYAAFFDEERQTWTAPLKILDPQQATRELRRWVPRVGNSVVVAGPQGELWLFYTSLLGGWSTASLNLKVSREGGLDFGRSRRLLLSPFFNLPVNVKNRGLLFPDGRYVLPVYQEFFAKHSLLVWIALEGNRPRAQICKIPRSRPGIQAALVPLEDGRLVAFFRNAAPRGSRYLLRSESPDGGRNWLPLEPTRLPNPNSGFDMLPTASGAILGAVNPAFEDRSQLALVLSRDGGFTWQTRLLLEDTPGQEYSYPSLLRHGNFYHLTYTFERRRLKHLVFNEAWLLREAAGGR